jgi:fibronectin-binding autotransporter adhesin
MSIKHFASATVLALAVAPVARAQTITIDGQRDANYGAAMTLQTNNTQFGNSTSGDGNSGGGSELDAAYGIVQGGSLNLFLAGNFENNGNKVNIFIADGRAGQNTINAAPGGSNLNNMNTSRFSPGFNATYELDVNQFGANVFVNQYDMTQAAAPATFFGSFTPNTGGATILHGVTFSLNNTNVAGVDGSAPSAADPAAAAAVATGMEISIPLSQLGSPSGSISVMADINSGGNNFLSNQFLPGLPTVSGNIGNGGKFDFSGTPNMFFTITVPSTGSTVATWNKTGSGSWSDSSSWSGGIPHLATDSATLGGIITGAATVSLDGPKTVGRLVFNSLNSYTIATGTGGQLTIDDTGDPNGVNPTISNQAGNHTILAPVVLANGVNVNTTDNTNLQVSGVVSGSGGIAKSGGGKLVLSGANTFAGNIVVDGGVLEVANNAAASGATVILGDPDVDNLDATLSLGSSGVTYNVPITTNHDLAGNDSFRHVAGSYASGGATLNSLISVNGGVVFSALSGASLTVNGTIQAGNDTTGSARHGLGVEGQGTVVLNTNVSNPGETFVRSGTLVVNPGISITNTNLSVVNGGTIIVNGSITLNGNTDTGSLTLNRSASVINIGAGGSIAMQPSVTANLPLVQSIGSLTFANSTSKLDLGNNRILRASSLAETKTDIANTNLLTSFPGLSVGYADIGSGTIDIRAVFGGDANLDGQVNTDDFNVLAGHFNETGDFWQSGDFNYDGKVNALDFNSLASNFGKTLSSPALGALVPEPAAMALVVTSLLATRRRRF